MRPLKHLKYWEAHSVTLNDEERRVYLPIEWEPVGKNEEGQDIFERQHLNFSPNDLKRMKGGYAPKNSDLDVHHMGRQDGSFALVPTRLHHGNTSREIWEPFLPYPNYELLRTTTAHDILHSCPPIESKRLRQLQQLVVYKNPFSMVLTHQEPPVAKHDGGFGKWKSTIWRGYATYLERLQYGLDVDEYHLPHPKEDSIIKHFMQEAFKQWEHLKGKLSHNKDAHHVARQIKEKYPVLEPQDIFHGVVRYLLS